MHLLAYRGRKSLVRDSLLVSLLSKANGKDDTLHLVEFFLAEIDLLSCNVLVVLSFWNIVRLYGVTILLSILSAECVNHVSLVFWVCIAKLTFGLRNGWL